MKTKVAIVILALVAVGLGIGLISMNQQATSQQKDDEAKYQVLSNEVAKVTGQWEDEKQARQTLQQDLDARKADIVKLSNTLSQTTETLDKTQAALRSEQEEVAARDAKIAKLESDNSTLDKQSGDLKTSIGDLEAKIADTQKKLEASEGDKAFLNKELKRLMGEKADLERQFNDLAVLKAQVHKLKVEMATARRLEWIRTGVFARANEKGAEMLMHPVSVNSTSIPKMKPSVATNLDLNVEVNSDGSVKVIPPITNPPPANKQ